MKKSRSESRKQKKRFSDIKERISKLQQVVEDDNVGPGMKLDVVTTELEERMDGEDSILPARKMPERTTRLQRQNAARHATEV